jgi:D-aspartate ligase
LSPAREAGRPDSFLQVRRPAKPFALVMGDLDVVRPLTLAGVPCALFTTARHPARASRLVAERLPWIDHYAQPDRVISLILAFASRQAEAPVLLPQSDADLLLVSRGRERLSRTTRFLLPPAAVVEDLVDKARFLLLADGLELKVPRSQAVPAGTPLGDIELPTPLLLKPLLWTPAWRSVTPWGKALRVDSPAQLDEVSRLLAELEIDVLAQELVPGPESRIESYHVYVDPEGRTAGEFTGRKIRTWPPVYGDSSAVEITNAADVLRAGRSVVRALGLVGLAKLDFKRSPAGALHLLEINPRASLWHHPGALAGVNLPALLHADLSGLPRPHVDGPRPGVRWCHPLRDARSARAQGVPARQWLAFLRACEARSELARDDPLPFLRRSAQVARKYL